MVRTNTNFGKYRYKINTTRHDISEKNHTMGKVMDEYSSTKNEIKNEKDPRIKPLLEKINSSKDHYEIIALSSELIGINPKHYYGYLRKAISYHRLKQEEKSEQSFKEAIKKVSDPRDKRFLNKVSVPAAYVDDIENLPIPNRDYISHIIYICVFKFLI